MNRNDSRAWPDAGSVRPAPPSAQDIDDAMAYGRQLRAQQAAVIATAISALARRCLRRLFHGETAPRAREHAR